MNGARALIIVDVQNDFCEGGALSVEGGNSTATAIAQWLRRHKSQYSLVIATRDWHPIALAGHFAPEGAEPDFVDTWPAHCIAGTPGADFHPDLPISLVDRVVSKGGSSAAYSGFEGITADGTTLRELLRAADADGVDVCGIATSHCVRATVLDARTAGVQVRLLADLCVGVTQGLASTAIDVMRAAGVEVARTGVAPR